MRKKIISFLKYILFFALGILLFWWIYKDMNIAQIKEILHEVNYWWLLVSFLLGMFSHVSRAYRWNMLIKPLGYQPKVVNTFLSIMVMYLVNLALPRAGEIARCTVLTRYEKVPFTKLVGTVVIERITDVIALVFFAFLILSSQVGVFNQFLKNNSEVHDNFSRIFSGTNLLLGLGLLITGIIALWFFRKKLTNTKMGGRAGNIIRQFAEGIKTVVQLENKWTYIGHTCFIYLMWLIAMYVVFFSYPPTMHLSFAAAMVTFVMGGLAMIAPVQAGIGAYHFMIASTLVIYGISMEEGKVLALIAWAISNIALMIAGTIAFIVLPVINRKREFENTVSEMETNGSTAGV